MTSSSDDPAYPPKRTARRGASIITKAIGLLVVVALVPVAFVSLWLTGLYRSAVETTEKQLQTATLAEISGIALHRVEDVQADTEAIAGALALAVAQPSEESNAFGAVKSLLATRRSIRAARLEVPAAKVSTVLRQSDVKSSDVPESSAELRNVADERGVAFSVIAPLSGIVVVPMPRSSSELVKGYVSARVDLSPFVEALRGVAETRFSGSNIRIAVADKNYRLVAGFGLGSVSEGTDISSNAIWRILPAGTPWTRRVGVVSEHVQDGVEMVGAVETVPQLGWAIALWRPKVTAYANLSSMTQRFELAAAISLIGALLVGLFAARKIVSPIIGLSTQARLIGQRRWREIKIDEHRSDEIGDLGRSIRDMAQSLESTEAKIEEETRLRADLSRFMSRELVDAIVSGEHSLELGGKRADITVLFADVVAFTPLAESQPPERVVALLNELFGMLSEVVFRHGGTVDKFIGDCIMAVWGVPVAQADHGNRALAAAEEMMRFLEVANEDWKERFQVELRLAIGVNSGHVIVGNIGSKKRMEYTVVGDVVNVAARLESIAQPNQVLVAQHTRELAKDSFSFKSRGEHRLTGREAQTTVYELVLS